MVFSVITVKIGPGQPQFHITIR